MQGGDEVAKRKLKPVTIAGIEFDALLDTTKTLSATIPTYPVEEGFPVSDTIILEPLSIQMTLYISNTPVTWLYRHGSSMDRVNRICEQLENLWLEKKLVKIVTTDTIYQNMGITNITIKKSKELGYAREVSLQAQKVRITKRQTVTIPTYLLKSGKTQTNAGTASTSTTSYKSNVTHNIENTSKKNSVKSDAKKKQSILYGVASGLKLI